MAPAGAALDSPAAQNSRKMFSSQLVKASMLSFLLLIAFCSFKNFLKVKKAGCNFTAER
jgi:hypothetical protein